MSITYLGNGFVHIFNCGCFICKCRESEIRAKIRELLNAG